MWQVVGGGPSSYLLNLHVSALGGGELREASSAARFGRRVFVRPIATFDLVAFTAAQA